MTKSDLAKHLATAHGLSQAAATAILEDAIEQIVTALSAGDKVRLAGLGVLAPTALAARSGTGPNGQPYHAPARMTVRLHPAASLEARLPEPAA